MSFTEIPTEILYIILSSLDSEKDIISLSSTCKRFRVSIPLKLKPIVLSLSNTTNISEKNTSQGISKIPRQLSFPVKKVAFLNIIHPTQVFSFIRKHRVSLKEIILDFFEYDKSFLTIDLLKRAKRLEKTVLFFSKALKETKINIDTEVLHIISSVTNSDTLKVNIFSQTQFEKITCDPYVEMTINQPIKELEIYIYSIKQSVFEFSNYDIDTLIVNINTFSEVAFFVFELPKTIKSLSITNTGVTKCYVQILKNEICQIENISLKNVMLFFDKFSDRCNSDKLETLTVQKSQVFNFGKIFVKHLFVPFSGFDCYNIEIENMYIFCLDAKFYSHLSPKFLHVKTLFFEEFRQIMDLKETRLLKDVSQIVFHIQEVSFNRVLLTSLIDFLKDQGFQVIRFKKVLNFKEEFFNSFCFSQNSQNSQDSQVSQFSQPLQTSQSLQTSQTFRASQTFQSRISQAIRSSQTNFQNPFYEFFSGDFYLLIANKCTLIP